MSQPIQIIFVPQGPEYQAVCQALNQAGVPITVLAIPVGPKPLVQYLVKLQVHGTIAGQNPGVLLMGLCGSLTPQHTVGDVVLYQGCVCRTNTASKLLQCNPNLTAMLQAKLNTSTPTVKALTSDRLVYLAAEKQQLAQTYDTDVVDMEGYAALKVLAQAGVAVGMVRVVSDDCHHDLPNLTAAFSPAGKLQPLPLALGLLRQPVAATRLIRGSLRGLEKLREVTTHLFKG